MISEAKANPGKIDFCDSGCRSSVSHLGRIPEIARGHQPRARALFRCGSRGPGCDCPHDGLASVNISGMLGHVQSGALRALVQTGKERVAGNAGCSHAGESGIRDAVLETTQFLLAPAGTPPAIIDRLSSEVLVILQKPVVRDRRWKGDVLP